MDDYPYIELKHQLWRTWFDETIPMINGLSPREAARTSAGQRELDRVLDFYDSRAERVNGAGGGGIMGNPPSAYVRWKLGYGPGSAQQFSAEERVYNYGEGEGPGVKTTQRSDKHEQRLERKMQYYFVPRRCEVAGCDKVDGDVNTCGRCKAVFYCGKEHQQADWDRHKKECKFLAKHPVARPKPFSPTESLQKYPIGCYPFENATNERCSICGSTAAEVQLGYTECCNIRVSDNAHEYQMFSYDRSHCMRSHDRYTACASHCHEGHSGDWRECAECNSLDCGARRWHATNAFSLVPPLAHMACPQGSFITQECYQCHSRIHNGFDGCSMSYEGGQTRLTCLNCSGY